MKQLIILFSIALCLSSCVSFDTSGVYSAGNARPEIPDTAVSSPSERPFAEAAAASQINREAPAAEAEEEEEIQQAEDSVQEVPAEVQPSKNISIPITSDVPVVVTSSPAKAEIAEEAADAEEMPEEYEEAPHEAEPVIMTPIEAISEVKADGDGEEIVLPAEDAAVSASEVSPSMDIWMVQLMIASIVIVILFTVATAIRNAYRMPLPRPMAIAVTAALSLVPIAISAAVGGMSWIWLVYLLLSASYFILRGRGGKALR